MKIEERSIAWSRNNSYECMKDDVEWFGTNSIRCICRSVFPQAIKIFNGEGVAIDRARELSNDSEGKF
jgi:hypothetical protein